MRFYQQSKPERTKLVATIKRQIFDEYISGKSAHTILYFSNDDTYIRKAAYLSVGRIYLAHQMLREKIIIGLRDFLREDDFKTRQTVINAAGEIGKAHFNIVQEFFDRGLFDPHHSPRNAVIGSIKKMGEANPQPVLIWAKEYLHHPDKEIRREICHGIELRGRTAPQDILPLLKEIQYDSAARVRKTLVHVIGQISYKKDCLQIVIAHLQTWGNSGLVNDALKEIIDVHDRYKNFAAMTKEQAQIYIRDHYSSA